MVHMILVKQAIDLLRPATAVRKILLLSVPRQSSASKLDTAEAPLVLKQAYRISLSSILLNIASFSKTITP